MGTGSMAIREVTLPSGESFTLSDWGDYPMYSRATIQPGAGDSIVWESVYGLGVVPDEDAPAASGGGLTLEGRVNQIIQGLESLTSVEHCLRVPFTERMAVYEHLKVNAETYQKLLGDGPQAIRLAEASGNARQAVLNELTGKSELPDEGYRLKGGWSKGFDPEALVSDPGDFGLTVRLTGPRQRPIDAAVPGYQAGSFRDPALLVTPADLGPKIIQPARGVELEPLAMPKRYGTLGSNKMTGEGSHSGWPDMGWGKKK